MKIENFPSHLPAPPTLKKGYKYIYRGTGWKARDIMYIYYYDSLKYGHAWSTPSYRPDYTMGDKNSAYLEIVEEEEEENKDMDKLGEMKRQYSEAKKLIGKKVYVPRGAGVGGNSRDEGTVTEVFLMLLKEDSSMSCEDYYKQHGFCVVVRYCDGVYSSPYPIVKLIDDSKTVVLNANYVAEVFKDKVVVGCQTFPIDILDKLMEAKKSL